MPMTGESEDDIFVSCLANIGANITVEAGLAGDSLSSNQATSLLLCVARLSKKTSDGVTAGLDTFFSIYAASLVFFMQAGFAMLCAGAVQRKNVQNTMLKNLLDACGAALGFYSFGYAFAYGGSLEGGSKTFIGSSNFFLINVDDYTFWM